MSMSASCTITNKTGGVIMFTTINKVNDDATWGINPPVRTRLENGQSCQIAMGNSSIFPRGVGFNATFVDGNFNVGDIYLDDPAVGAHHFAFNGNFQFTDSNPAGNSYDVTINPV